MSDLRSAVDEYIEMLSAGGYDVPRRRVAEDLRTLLTAATAERPAAAADPEQTGLPAGSAEYAILSFRDGLEPVDSLDEAGEHMRMFWQKPGRARVMHRQAFATEWAPLDQAAEGPLLEAA